MEKIREVFSEEAKAKEKQKKTLRAKRRQGQAEKLKQSLIGVYTLQVFVYLGVDGLTCFH